MTTLYKLMDENDQTKNKTQWGDGVTVAIPSKERGSRLCGKGILHAYTSPLQAALFQPIHGDAAKYTRLRRAEGDVVTKNVDKVGCHVLTTYELADLPKITVEQRVEIAIRCAKELPDLPKEWVEWADKWLSGEDRSEAAAWTVADVAAANAAANAADAATAAANAAARAADAAATAATAAADAAWAAAAWAARAAANAAGRAATGVVATGAAMVGVDVMVIAEGVLRSKSHA